MLSAKTTVDQSCILFRDERRSVALIDIPRSLEESQVLPGQIAKRRLLSADPISTPFPTPEPKDAGIRLHSQPPSALLSELMTRAAVESGLETLNEHYTDPLFLPRVVQQSRQETSSQAAATEHFIPENSVYLHGSIQELRDKFVSTAPAFDLIVLDPPWPNRSAKRKRNGYSTLYGLEETRHLLSMIPIASHLAPEGLVAIWVTNKPSLTELLTSTNGIFASWSLEVVTEWIWLKITSKGEPICDLESQWRKPWERLLIARRIGSHARVSPMVILAVPDVHSRKPNLRCLFADLLPASARCLEVFARNLTAGWWSWGDEVLRFQGKDQWLDCEARDANDLNENESSLNNTN